MAASGVKSFKSTVIGGFDKQDVMQYIERAARERREAERVLIAERDRLLLQCDELRRELAAQAAAPSEELAAKLEQSELQTEALRAERDALLTAQAALAAELGEAHEARTALEQRGEELELRSAALDEREVCVREAEERSRRDAAQLRESLVRLASETRERYGGMRTDVQSAADRLVAHLSDLSALAQVLGAVFDQADAELSRMVYPPREQPAGDDMTDMFEAVRSVDYSDYWDGGDTLTIADALYDTVYAPESGDAPLT